MGSIYENNYLMIQGHFMSKHFAFNTFAIGKDEILKKWKNRILLGNLGKITGKIVFINRDVRNEAMEAISSQAVDSITPGSAGIILCDKHRPYPENITDSREKWSVEDRYGPDLLKWMEYTCFPYSGGLWTLGENTDDDIRFLDCTIVEPKSIHDFGGNLHIDVREISRKELFGDPPSIEHLQQKLIELWIRKNEMIRRVRQGY